VVDDVLDPIVLVLVAVAAGGRDGARQEEEVRADGRGDGAGRPDAALAAADVDVEHLASPGAAW
jgi:hypothetical protein